MSTNAGIAPACPHSAEKAAEAAKQAVAGAQKKQCACQKLLNKRRVHAVMGVYFALFLMAHLSIAATGLKPDLYRSVVATLHTNPPLIVGACWLLIAVPLLVQLGIGSFLLYKHGIKYNVKKCERGGKLRFYMQRVTGLSILVFLGLHLATLGVAGFLRYSTHPEVYGATLAAFGSAASLPLVVGLTWKLLALVGTLAVAWHIGNGFWSGAILFKLAPNGGNRASNAVSLTVGLLLGLSGLCVWAIYALV